jgi:hypothetical protein
VNTTFSTLTCAGMLLLPTASSAEISSNAPQHFNEGAPLVPLDMGLKLSHNSSEAVRDELSNTNTIRLIASSAGIKEEDLASVLIAPGPDGTDTWLYQIGDSNSVFSALLDQLSLYVQARLEGHTRAFLYAALTNRVPPSAISDPDLRVLLTNRPLIPGSWLNRMDSGTSTNKAYLPARRSMEYSFLDGREQTNQTTSTPKVDEVCRWVLYSLTDGDVAWQYVLSFNPSDGSLDRIIETRCDAKEYDPQYRQIMRDVKKEVDADMRRSGTVGQFGSVHAAWQLKQEKLKARGIKWRSPAELNPNFSFE